MKFSLQKTVFMDLLQKAYPIIPSRTSLQVLNNLKITIQDQAISIIASDLDNFVKVTAPIDEAGDAEIAVSGRKLFDIIKELGNELLSFEIEENILYIANETGFNCSLTGVDIREFPHFPESDYSNRYNIPKSDFIKMIAKSSFAVSRDESRACLCGVLCEISGDRIGMVATDGHRLGASFCDYLEKVEDEVSSIIPQKSLNHIARILDGSEFEELSFSIFNKHILFTIPGFTMSTKLIDGPYPDYEKGIPKEFSKEVIIDKSSLQASVKRVCSVSVKSPAIVKFHFVDSLLTVSTTNTEIGADAKQVIPIEYNSEEHLAGFNANYLLEILSVIPTESVRIAMNGPVGATLIYPVSEAEEEQKFSDLFLIMPLRIYE